MSAPVTDAPAAARLELSELGRRLRLRAPWIQHVVFVQEDDQLVARIHLDPMMIKARAIQQGLADESVAAAAGNPRVQRAIAAAVAAVNRTVAPGMQLQRHEIVAA